MRKHTIISFHLFRPGLQQISDLIRLQCCAILILTMTATTALAQSKNLPFLLLLLSGSNISLSTQKAAPGQIITIIDSTIREGEDFDITFSDGKEYHLILKPFSVTSGSAKVVVPPYFNNQTDRYESANVTLSLTGQKRAQLFIENLPDLAGIAPGTVITVYLQKINDNLTLSLPDIDQLGLTYGHDVTGLKFQLQLLIDEISSLLSEINTTGTFNTSSLALGISPINETDLKIVDQLLYAMMLGIYQEKQISTPVALSTAKLMAQEPLVTLEQIADGVTSSGQTVKVSFPAFTTPLKSFLDTFGDPSKVGDITILIDVLEAGFRIVAVGGMNEIANMIRSMDPDHVFEPGQGFVDEFSSVVNDVVEANYPQWAKDIQTLVSKLQGLLKARVKLLCDQQPLPSSLTNTCLEWQVHPTVYPHIRKAYFSQNNSRLAKPEILTGVSEQFYYEIGGSAGLEHAKITTVTIDWGDESTETLTHNSGYPDVDAFGGHSTEHTYILPGAIQTKVYDIKVAVSGDNDPGGTHKHEYTTTVTVTTDTAPLEVNFTQGDDLLRTNQKGTWVVEVIGGAPPFEMTLIRDTWNIDAQSYIKKDRLIRINTLQHAYSVAGWYTITFKVKDAKGDEIEASYDVLVGDGPYSDYLIVDRVEFYAYGNQCGDTGACLDEEDISWWYSKISHYDITAGTAQFKANYTFSVEEVDYTVNFAFDLPPRIIKKGADLPTLYMSGEGTGFTLGWYLDRQVGYYTKTSPTSSNIYLAGELRISNREMPYDESSGKFTGSISKNSSSVIAVPAGARDGFCIGVKHGWDPGFYITWVYKNYTSP